MNGSLKYMDTKPNLDRITSKLPNRITTPLRRVGTWDRRAGIMSALLFLTLAVQPAAAQNEHCSSAVTAMFNMAFGMTFGYGREIFIGAILIAGFLVLKNGLSSAQGVVGLGIFALAVGVLIFYMITIDFVTFGFDQINAPPSCTGQFTDGGGAGGGGDGGDGAPAVITTVLSTISP